MGFYAWVGAILLIIFLVPTTLIMHRFWDVEDPQMAMIEMVNFTKNWALVGAMLVLWYAGSGPFGLA